MPLILANTFVVSQNLLWYCYTLYKLYALPVSHIISTREDMHYPWVISSIPVSHILSTCEDMQYPWVISSVRESYPQYPWGYALPVSHIISTRELYPQYPWGYAVPVSRIISTREDMQYRWVNLYEWRMNETSLTGNAYAHGYCISSRVLMIWLTGTAYPHGYWGYDSRVLHTLTGTAYPHGYWGYDSRVLHTLTGTAYSLYRVCYLTTALRSDGNHPSPIVNRTHQCYSLMHTIKRAKSTLKNVRISLQPKWTVFFFSKFEECCPSKVIYLWAGKWQSELSVAILWR